MLLVPIYRGLGLNDEAERLIEDRWEHLNALGEEALKPAIKLVRQHIELTSKATPVETLRAVIRGGRSGGLRTTIGSGWVERTWQSEQEPTTRPSGGSMPASGADRTTSRSGAPAELGCRNQSDRRRRRGHAHLPPAELKPAELRRINAWLAAKRGDFETERRELEGVLAADPADLMAIERLAQLAEKDKQAEEAALLHRKKAEIHRLRARYRNSSSGNSPFAMRWKWRGWPSGSAAISRPEVF